MKKSYIYFIFLVTQSWKLSYGYTPSKVSLTRFTRRSPTYNIPALLLPTHPDNESRRRNMKFHSTVQIQELDNMKQGLETNSNDWSLNGEYHDSDINNNNNDNSDKEQEEQEEQMTCRIAASADGKLHLKEDPSSSPPDRLLRRQIDQIYNAKFYTLFKSLSLNIHQDVEQEEADAEEKEECLESPIETTMSVNAHALKKSLEQSGFRLWKKRDLDLCEALNEGYLLRLSIQPDLKDFDPNLGRDLYPELYPFNSTAEADNSLLFDGRILIFTRGYSQEITRGRLLLPKFDYLQSSLVQRSAFAIARRLGQIESEIVQKMMELLNKCWHSFKVFIDETNAKIPSQAQPLLKKGMDFIENVGKKETYISKRKPSLKLERYVGSSAKYVDSPNNDYDALNPFLVCELEDKVTRSMSKDEEENVIVRDLLQGCENGQLKCKYDLQKSNSEPMHLLKRVSISNLVDFFSTGGRRRLIQSLFSISELIEPTYEEVCILWRPLPHKKTKPKKAFRPPKLVYYLAELFDLVDQLPKKDDDEPKLPPRPLEIRTFDRVPMANVQAVFPKTKLIFRPADALILDAVNTISLLAVLASQRFDSPKLDIIALVSVLLWVVRTFFRYSNKIARYDLLINKFLTSRITHRNRGALQYIVNEAAMQRSQRASLVHEWLKEKYDAEGSLISRNDILSVGQKELNARLRMDQPVNIDVNAALIDLTALNLIKFNENDELVVIRTEALATEALTTIWDQCFEVAEC
jgi:hypothetical protein